MEMACGCDAFYSFPWRSALSSSRCPPRVVAETVSDPPARRRRRVIGEAVGGLCSRLEPRLVHCAHLEVVGVNRVHRETAARDVDALIALRAGALPGLVDVQSPAREVRHGVAGDLGRAPALKQPLVPVAIAHGSCQARNAEREQQR